MLIAADLSVDAGHSDLDVLGSTVELSREGLLTTSETFQHARGLPVLPFMAAVVRGDFQ
jgi:hypothetical protein